MPYQDPNKKVASSTSTTTAPQGSTPVGSHQSRAVSSTDVPDGGAGGRSGATGSSKTGSSVNNPGGVAQSSDLELTLTGDQDTDFNAIADAYKPRDMDANMWRGMWRSVLSGESGGNLQQGEAEYGKDQPGVGARATGPMQVKPSTARGLGFTDEEFKSNPYVRFAAGVKLLRDDWSALGGRASSPSHRAAMTFAAYHAGRPRVEANLDSDGDGIPDIDDGRVNTRDYTFDKLQRLQQYLDSISANQEQPIDDEQIAEETGVKLLLDDEEAGVPQAGQEAFSSAIVRNAQQTAQNYDERLNEKDKLLREELGLIAPENYPHKVTSKPVPVIFELQPGQQLSAEMMNDAVTNAITGDAQSAQKFRLATGEEPGGFLAPEVGDEWLKKQIENGTIRVNDVDGRVIVEANIPVQSYVLRRINAMAKGGAAEVQAETARMREEVTQEERRAAEIRYGNEIAELKRRADELDLAAENKRFRAEGGFTGGAKEILRDIDPDRFFGTRKAEETPEAKKLRDEAAVLEAELERRFPATSLDQISLGIRRTYANTAQLYRNLERNVKNIGEAVVYTNDKEYAEKMAKRDKQYKKVAESLQAATPGTRSVNYLGVPVDIGGAIETVGTAVAFDAPLYLAGGAVFGPSGVIYTTAIRSADKNIDEFVKDIAAGVLEIPIGRAVTGVVNRVGYTRGVQEAGEKLFGRIASDGLGEVGGDATIQYLEGKKLDWANALKNFIAGGAFGITGGGRSKEGTSKVNQQEEVPIIPWSPMGVAVGKDGQNRYQILLKQGDDVALVELPADSPLVLKYAAQADAGGMPFLAFSNEQFDQAMDDFKGSGKAKLPKMTTQQATEYLSAIAPGTEAKQDVKQDEEQRVEGADRLRDGAPVSEVGQIQETEGEIEKEKQPVKQREQQAVEREAVLSESDKTALKSAYKKLGVKTAEEAQKVVQEAGRRFVKKLTPEEKTRAELMQARMTSLSGYEQRVLGKVLPAAFAAPVQAREGGEEGEGESRRIEAMTDEEFEKEPQLVANEREVGEFFDKAKKGEVVTAITAEEKAEAKKASKEFEEKQKSIAKGTKQVTKNGVKITLPNDLAAEWEQADLTYETTTKKIEKDKSLTLSEKSRKQKEAIAQRKQARDKIFDKYQIEENRQIKRGFLKGSNLPVTIIEEKGDKYVIREANKDETREVLKESVETQKERALQKTKKAKLPLSVRAKALFGGFDVDKPVSKGKDGVVYVNDEAQKAVEEAIGVEISDGITFSNENLPAITKKLRTKGLDAVAKQLESQAKGRSGSAIVSVTGERAGEARFHEQVHTAAYDKQISDAALEDLYKENNPVRKLLDALMSSESDIISTEFTDMHPADFVQEVLAYGLTGDFDGLGVDADLLYDALVEVGQVMNNEFPNETLANIAENGLVNFEKIDQEIKSRSQNAKQESGSKAEVGKPAAKPEERKQKEGKGRPEKTKQPERAESLNIRGLRDKYKDLDKGEKRSEFLNKKSKEQAEKNKKGSKTKAKRSAAETKFTSPKMKNLSLEMKKLATEYATRIGKKYEVGENYDFDPVLIMKIADLMESNLHEPMHPDVVKSYAALAKETVDQYNFFVEKGYTAEPWFGEGDPYGTDSAKVRQDVRENKHLWFFLGSDMDPNHPMAQPSGIKIGEYDASVNDVFRVVHDFFGHTITGAEFGPRGELNATDSHARMYSAEAIPAMLGETVFQNAWVNFGPHIRRGDGTIPNPGDKDYIPRDKRPYAEQKAMNITPEMVGLWLRTYKTEPKPFFKGGGKKEGFKRDVYIKQELDRINRKKVSDMTPDDIHTVVKDGKFATISGNTANLEQGEAALKRGVLKTQTLKRELERMGYKVLEADGVYAPEKGPANIEPSLLVLLNDDLDIPNIIRLGMRYKQGQVLIGDSGEYRAPFTRNVESGKIGNENYGPTNKVLFGKAAESEVGKTRVRVGGQTFSFSTPDTFTATRKQNKKELEYVKALTKAFNDRVKNPLKATSADLYAMLKQRAKDGDRQPITNEEAAAWLEKTTNEMYGKPAKLKKQETKGRKRAEVDIEVASQNAQRARRARTDLMAMLKDRLFGKGERTTDDETGLSWYAAAIRRMHQITGQAFPEVLNTPQLRALFDLMVAVSSQGNKVIDNFRYTMDLWMRIINEFDLGQDGAERTVPTKLKATKRYIFQGEERESTNYGRFGPQLEKFNFLTQGYIPVPTGKSSDYKAAGYEMKKSAEFEDVQGATQWFYKDKELVADLEKYGHIGGVFEYLLKPGKTKNNPYRSTEVLGPKIGAFFLNIAGFSQLVTVDMWASRWFYRVTGGLLNNGEIQETPLNERDGDLIRGVFQDTANEWNKLYGKQIKLSPADIQAIAWYFEKDIWNLAGADDSGTIDFATAAQKMIDEGRRNPDMFGDIDGTSDYRDKVVARFVSSAPAPGEGLLRFGTPEAAEANRNFFVTQMAVPARIGLSATSRKQVQNRKLLNFDSQEWNKLAEHAQGKPLEQAQINNLYTLLQNGYAATTKIEKEEAIKDLNDFVDDLAKQSLPDFIISVIRAGMLSGVKTTARNISSNFAYAVMEESRRGVSAPMDVLIAASAPSGERSIQGISPSGVFYALKKALTDGFRQFFKTLIHGDPGAAYETFNPGYDPKVRSSIFTFGKTGANVLNYTVGNFAKYIFRFQQAQDNVFRTYAYNRSLYELAVLAQRNKTGRSFQDVLTNPTVTESDMAWRAAEAAVFQNDNPINTAYQRAKTKAPDPVRWLLEYEMPFVKTGSNIFMETMNYSVFGLLWGGAKGATAVSKALKEGGWTQAKKEMWEAIDNPEVRRTIINCFSKGLVGTGIATIGFWLAAKGLLYGMGGEEDERERNKRMAQGAGAGHLKVLGEWYDLRGLSPVGTLLISGASYWHALNKDMKSEDPWRRMDEVMKTVSSLVIDGLPLARTVNDFTNPRSGQSMAQRFIGADRVVPAFIGDIAIAQDDVQREIKGDTLGESIKASIQKKVPETPITKGFNRKGLPEKRDVFGKMVEQGSFWNPLSPKTDKTNDVIKEAKEVGWSFSAPKIDTKNKESRADFIKRRNKTGEIINQVFDAVIHDKNYPSDLPKEERKKILEDSATVARKAVKREEKLTKSELGEIVENLIGSARDKVEASSDPDLTVKEQKEVRKKVSSAYSKAINKILGVEPEE